MWEILQESPLFFIKLICNDNKYEVFITNYLNIWSSNLSAKILLDILKECNEGLELEDEEDFLNIGIEMLSNPSKLKKIKIVEKDSENIEIFFTKLQGFPMKLKLCLRLNSNKCMFKEVIQPLLKIIHDLHTSETELRKELIKKDKEIEEYKCEGGEIALRHLKTVVYNDDVHMRRHSAYKDNFGDSNIPDKLLQPVECEIANSDTNITKSSSNGNINDIKTEQNLVTESTIKIESDRTIKIEPLSQSDKVENSTQVCDIKPKLEHSDIPRKRQRNKLNL